MLTFFFGTFCTTRFTACTFLCCVALFVAVFFFAKFLVCLDSSFFTILLALYHTSSVYKTY